MQHECQILIRVLHFDIFSESQGAVSDQQGERFCQDLKTMEEHYHMRQTFDGILLLKSDCPENPQTKERQVQIPA